jgi:hypothetical protein
MDRPVGLANDHEAAASDVACAGMRDREREMNRDGRVDGIPAATQDIESDFGRLLLGADDHRAVGHDRAPPARLLSRGRRSAGKTEDGREK